MVKTSFLEGVQKNVCETSQQVLIFFKKLTLFHSAIYHAIALKHSTFNFIGLPLSLSHTAGCEMSRYVAVIAYKCKLSLFQTFIDCHVNPDLWQKTGVPQYLRFAFGGCHQIFHSQPQKTNIVKLFISVYLPLFKKGFY